VGANERGITKATPILKKSMKYRSLEELDIGQTDGCQNSLIPAQQEHRMLREQIGKALITRLVT
jgi:hypothetical protein